MGDDEREQAAFASEVAWRRKAQRSNIVLVVSIVAALCWACLSKWYEPWTLLRVAGLVVFMVAVALVFVARLQLGSAFTTKAEARHLVTHGLYARVQNPIYFISAIGIAGLILFLNKPWFFLYLLIVVPVQVMRVRQERRVLAEAFGEEYERYRRQTWF